MKPLATGLAVVLDPLVNEQYPDLTTCPKNRVHLSPGRLGQGKRRIVSLHFPVSFPNN